MAGSTIWAPVGDKGPDGDPGPVGPQGPEGPQGPPGPGMEEFEQFKLDLASTTDTTKGSTFVGWLRDVTGAVGAKLNAFLSWGDVHAFEFLTVAEIIAVRNGTAGDMRAKLQLAVDAAVGKTLRINAGFWKMIPLSQANPTVGLCVDVPSNVKIVGDPGNSIELLAHNNTIYQMFRVWDRDNVTIEGLNLDGRKDLNAATEGEFGMGIDWRGGSNININNNTCNNMWGDGFYQGMTNTGETTVNCRVVNLKATGCRRQGMSVTSAKELDVEFGSAKDIGGANPSAGLDIEPNGNTAILEGIRIRGFNSGGNAGAGIVIELGAFAGAEPKNVDIIISDHFDDGSAIGVAINGLKTTGVVKGRIDISGTWINNTNQGVLSADFSTNGPAIKVSGAIIDCNRSGQTTPKYGSACVVLRDTTSETNYPIGNITFKHMDIECTTGTIVKPFYFDDTLAANTNVTNVHFIDPLKFSGLTGTGGGFFALGTISNNLQNWIEKLAGSASITANIYGPIEFADAASTITLTAGQFVRGSPDIYIRKPNNTNSHSVTAPAAGAFIGLGGTIVRLQSSVADSYLRLRPMGSDKFAIIERVGTWTEQTS